MPKGEPPGRDLTHPTTQAEQSQKHASGKPGIASDADRAVFSRRKLV